MGRGSYSRRTVIGVSGFCSCRSSGPVCIAGEKIANGLLLMRRFRSGCLFIPRLRFGRRRGGLCSSRLRAELGSRSRRGSGLGSAALLIPGLRSGCPFGAMGAVMFGGLLSERGGIAPFRPSNSMPMTKNRCLENPEHRFCCIHNETALNQASLRCNNNIWTENIPL